MTTKKIIIKNGRKEYLPNELAIAELAYCTDTNELYVGTEDGPRPLNDYGNVLSELSLSMSESSSGRPIRNISIEAPVYSHIQAQNQLEKDREKFKEAMLKAIEHMPFEDRKQYLQSIYSEITKED